ncbi:uncharacterized protein [Dermacentor andersoni]|uniref:uncharacterized protein n=1 Tax=Dermacentor andersoni TaxID=34620 RepID=UPI002416638B|nr:uncharacterized protein LOC129382577 [Dermacentor andersoni]
MALLQVLATLCCTLCYASSANPKEFTDVLLSRRPDLAVYQNFTKCLFRGSTWHALYRNTEDDGFGPDDRCLRDTQTSELAAGSTRVRFRYGTGQEWNGTTWFMEPGGQISPNTLKSLLDGGEYCCETSRET